MKFGTLILVKKSGLSDRNQTKLDVKAGALLFDDLIYKGIKNFKEVNYFGNESIKYVILCWCNNQNSYCLISDKGGLASKKQRKEVRTE